jgi:hypothetical protein
MKCEAYFLYDERFIDEDNKEDEVSGWTLGANIS